MKKLRSFFYLLTMALTFSFITAVPSVMAEQPKGAKKIVKKGAKSTGKKVKKTTRAMHKAANPKAAKKKKKKRKQRKADAAN